ncbi:MAG: hypothetical protein JW724_01280 [Candidatus Altiarchaeota archaeon]|nr:hypothetical protein [Candidatus Altiarchaeota archaeon]
MTKAEKKECKLKQEELAYLKAEIRVTRTWLVVSGIIALIIFGGMAILGVAGFFIGLIEATSQSAYYTPAQSDAVIFFIAGIIGIGFCSSIIWLGAAALLTAAKAKDYLITGSVTDLLLYHRRMRRVFVTIGGIAIFGIVMCVIAAVFFLVALAGIGMAVVD